DGRAVLEGDGDAALAPPDRLGSGVAEDGHAAAAEDVLDQVGRVLVLLWQDAVSGGDERDAAAQGQVGAGELGTGHTGADDDEVTRDLGQVVQLAPRPDAVAVGHRARPEPRAGAVADGLPGRLDRVGVFEMAGVRDDLDLLGREPGRDVLGLGPRQVGDPVVQARRVDRGQATGGNAEGVGAVQQRHRVRGLDERFGGDAVGEHARAPEAVGVYYGDVRAQLGRDQGRLVTARPAAQDGDFLL